MFITGPDRPQVRQKAVLDISSFLTHVPFAFQETLCKHTCGLAVPRALGFRLSEVQPEVVQGGPTDLVLLVLFQLIRRGGVRNNKPPKINLFLVVIVFGWWRPRCS
jgi:hypothetical protein